MLRFRRPAIAVVVLWTLWPALVFGQASKAGIVTTLEGNVTVTRVSATRPIPLHFKDDVFLQDRVVTGDRSIARLLLGGKAVVTIRERSVLTITEVPGKSTIDLASGKIALAVVHDKMRPGESIDIRTPNAIAGVRGTVVVADVSQPSAQVGGGPVPVVTHFYVLRGTITAVNLDLLTRMPITLPIPITVGQNFSVAGSGQPTVGPNPPLGVITAGLTPKGPTHVKAANQDQVKTQALQTAVSLVQAIVGPAPDQPAQGDTQGGQTTTGGGGADGDLSSASAGVSGGPFGVTLAGGGNPFGFGLTGLGNLNSANLICPSCTAANVLLSSQKSTGTGKGSGGNGPSPLTGPVIITPATPSIDPLVSGASFVTVGPAGANGTSSFSGTAPFLTTTGPNPDISGTAGATVTISGAVVNALDVGGPALIAVTSPDVTSTVPLLSVENVVDNAVSTPGALTSVRSLLSFTGQAHLTGLLQVLGGSSATFAGGDVVDVLPGTVFNSGSAAPAVLEAAAPASVPVFAVVGDGSVLDVPAGSLMSISGTANVAGQLAAALDGGVITVGTAPAFVVNGGSLALTDSLVSVAGAGAKFQTGGTLFSASDAVLTAAPNAPFVHVIGATAPLSANQNPGALVVRGSLVDLMNSPLDLGSNALVQLDDHAVFTNTTLLQDGTLANAGGPVVRVNGGSLNAAALIQGNGNGNTALLQGTLLDVTNASVTLGTLEATTIPSTDVFGGALNPGQALVHLGVQSTLTLTGAGAYIALGTGDPTISLSNQPASTGVALISSGAAETPNQIDLAGLLLRLGGINLQDPNAQIQLTSTTLTQSGADPLILIDGPSSTVGALVQATDSTISSASDLVRVVAGGSLVAGFAPLLDFTGGGVHTDGSLLAINGGNVTGPTAHTPRVAGSPTAALMQFDHSDVTSGQSVVRVAGPVPSAGVSNLSLSGSLIRAVHSSFDLGSGAGGSSNGTGLPRSWESNIGAQITACDDCTVPVSLGFAFPFRGSSFTTAQVSSNGFVTFGNAVPFGGCCNADVSSFLAGPARIAASWFDLIGGNGVHFNALPGRAVITWDHTFEYCCTGTNTFQMQLLSDGRIVFGFGAGSNAVSNGRHIALTGVTPGGDAADPGSTDLSHAAPLSTRGGTAYELFPEGTFDLSGTNVVFTPDGSGGWRVSLALGSPFLTVTDGGVLTQTAVDVPLVDLAVTPVIASAFLNVTNGARVDLAGPLLSAVDSPLTFSDHVIEISPLSTVTSSTSLPFMSLVRSPVAGLAQSAVDGSLFDVNGDLTVHGPLLSAVDSPIALTGSVVAVTGSLIMTNASPALISIQGTAADASTVTVGQSLTNVSGASSLMSGTLLSAANTTISTGSAAFAFLAGASVTATNSAPFIALDSTALAVGLTAGSPCSGSCAGLDQQFLDLSGTRPIPSGTARTSLILDGALLSASDSLATGRAVSTSGAFMVVRDGARLTSRTADALLQFSGTTINTGLGGINGDLVTVCANVACGNASTGENHDGASIGLNGGVLSSTNSTVNIASPINPVSLVSLNGDGALVTAQRTPATPVDFALVGIHGGSLTVGASTAGGQLFSLQGFTAPTPDAELDPVTSEPTGLTFGPDRPLQHAGHDGAIFEATDGATIQVNACAGGACTAGARGNAFRVDTALLEATAPLIALRSSDGPRTTMTTGGDVIDLVRQAKVTVSGESVAAIRLDRATLTANGNLVNVAGGSRLNIAGDLVSLGGASVLNVSGVLLNLSGGSIVSIGGALVNFIGTGNTINITNSPVATMVVAGIPISVAGGVRPNIAFGATALAGLTGNTINVNGTRLPANPTLGPALGSLVAIGPGGGSVKITGR